MRAEPNKRASEEEKLIMRNSREGMTVVMGSGAQDAEVGGKDYFQRYDSLAGEQCIIVTTFELTFLDAQVTLILEGDPPEQRKVRFVFDKLGFFNERKIQNHFWYQM